MEINLAGINQGQCQSKVGMTFRQRSTRLLCQDPDIIMVGEIRDLETAEIAIKAAQTGHMVLSTSIPTTAPQTLTRLANMGVAPYNILQRDPGHCPATGAPAVPALREAIKIPPEEADQSGLS